MFLKTLGNEFHIALLDLRYAIFEPASMIVRFVISSGRNHDVVPMKPSQLHANNQI